jgi:hypothetical protein
MKKLTNVSPFLLLLAPVFLVMLFTFTSNSNQANSKEIAEKTTTNPTSTVVKAASFILK